MKDKSVALIKWQKTGLENLLGSPYIKRRIRRSAIGDYLRDEYQNPPLPFNVAPTNVRLGIGPDIDDYRLKE